MKNDSAMFFYPKKNWTRFWQSKNPEKKKDKKNGGGGLFFCKNENALKKNLEKEKAVKMEHFRNQSINQSPIRF